MTITIDLTKAAKTTFFAAFFLAVSALSLGHLWGWLRHERPALQMVRRNN